MTDDAALREAAYEAFAEATGYRKPTDRELIRHGVNAAISVYLAARGDAPDDPEADGTDAAHPAWWRGHDHTTAVFCSLVHQVLDGEDDGKGVAREPWETLRRRLMRLAARGNARREALADGRDHLTVSGTFQSDRYPTVPAGKVPLSVRDPLAQDLLWEYARRHREAAKHGDSEFPRDLEEALRNAGFEPAAHDETPPRSRRA